MRGYSISLEDFLGRMREYLPAGFESSFEPSAGKAVHLPAHANVFHTFNSEVMLALSRAVEDIAMEDAYGRLLSSFQDFGKFQNHRERYSHIAATLDEVLVLGVGRKPKECGQVQFINADGTALERFWMSMYQGNRIHLLIISRQINEAESIPEKIFRGFFTFDARLISRIRREVLDALSGRQPAMPSFSRLSALDDARRQVRDRFNSELQALETELESLRQRPHLSPKGVLNALNLALDRLNQLRESVPAFFETDTNAKRPAALAKAVHKKRI
jgi:hypothetical protein